MMPAVCDHILLCHIDLAVVDHCDDVMQIFGFIIIIVILALLRHGILIFHKLCAVGFKRATTCFSILDHLQDILRYSHPFFFVIITEEVTPHIFHADMGIKCLLTGLYVDIGRCACGCSIQVRKHIDIINLKFIFSQ